MTIPRDRRFLAPDTRIYAYARIGRPLVRSEVKYASEMCTRDRGFASSRYTLSILADGSASREWNEEGDSRRERERRRENPRRFFL